MQRLLHYLGILLVIFLCKQLKAQKYDAYNVIVDSAKSAYDKEDYLKAANLYNEAFDALGGALYLDLYQAACAWSRVEEIDSAFKCMFRLAKPPIGGFENYELLEKEQSFLNLHKYEKWDSLLLMVKQNYTNANSNLDYDLMEELAEINADDQEIRGIKTVLDSIFEDNPVQRQKMMQDMLYRDSINLVKVDRIIEEYNWPGPNIIGVSGCYTLFLVIQHASPKVRVKYLPLFREAVKQGKAFESNLAMLEDRVLVDQGKPQIYGTQMEKDPETGEWRIAPIQDPENVDKRRISVNLIIPMSDYVKNWGLTWDVEQHKLRN